VIIKDFRNKSGLPYKIKREPIGQPPPPQRNKFKTKTMYKISMSGPIRRKIGPAVTRLLRYITRTNTFLPKDKTDEEIFN